MLSLRLGFVGCALLAAACGSPSSDSSDTSSSSADETISADRVHIVQKVTQTNLVSDQAGVAANIDPNAVNVWGISFNPAGPAWVSNNGTGTTTVYDSTGALHLTVDVPIPTYDASDAGITSTPTGQVFNASATDFNGDKFIFVTEDGTVSGWQPATGASLRDDYSSISVFKGVGLGPSMIYAADFKSNAVRTFDNQYREINTGAFKHPALPAHYAPFNVFVDGTRVFVSYAEQDSEKHDDVKGAGHGYVDLFDTTGNFQSRLVSRSVLNSPWGMAIAPASFGALAGSLLVGNTGDGRVNVFSLEDNGYGGTAATYKGALGDEHGKTLSIDNLWGIAVSPSTDESRLYFSAGPDHESHGLYGRLDIGTTTSTDAGAGAGAGTHE